MMLIFVSNFLNHHQIPICEQFSELCDDFYFVATDKVTNIGYQKNTEAPYVIQYFNECEKKRIEDLILQADVVIFGSCPNELIELRMNENKLSFLYSERFFKKGRWRRFIPHTRNLVYQRIAKFKKKNMYVLSASAYLPGDLDLIGYPINKCFKWGYFPKVEIYDLEELFDKKQKNKISILWVGRFIGLKHPDIAIQLAEKLKKEGYSFELNVIGDGELKNSLLSSIRRKNLEECVHILGSMTSEMVRMYMRMSNIFLFTSDRNEGWGAVLNEAMNSGCAIVANHVIGSVPYLIRNGENGFQYYSLDELYDYTIKLMENEHLRKKMGIEAYRTMINQWNPNVAAVRLLKLVDDITGEQEFNSFAEGPCSKTNKW